VLPVLFLALQFEIRFLNVPTWTFEPTLFQTFRNATVIAMVGGEVAAFLALDQGSASDWHHGIVWGGLAMAGLALGWGITHPPSTRPS
jgi:hypothetical protein